MNNAGDHRPQRRDSDAARFFANVRGKMECYLHSKSGHDPRWNTPE